MTLIYYANIIGGFASNRARAIAACALHVVCLSHCPFAAVYKFVHFDGASNGSPSLAVVGWIEGREPCI